MIHETPEGQRYRIGINYWFPKNNNTMWRIVFCLPLFAWYQRNYYNMDFDGIANGWRMLRFSFRIRRRNPEKFSEGYVPMLIFSHLFYITNENPTVVMTREVMDDMNNISLDKV